MKWERWYLWQIVRQKRTVQATETTLHGKEIYLTECCIIFRFFTVFCPMEWPSAVKSRNISFSVHLRWQFHLGYSNSKQIQLFTTIGRKQGYKINYSCAPPNSGNFRRHWQNWYFSMDFFRNLQLTVSFKVHIFWESHKILQNLQLTFDWHYIGQKYSGDFAKFCGLLRMYEL